MALASPPTAIAELRQLLERTESRGSAAGAALPFGIPELDGHLPGNGLQRGHLHEVLEGGPASSYAGLATLFTAGILARLTAKPLPSPPFTFAGEKRSRIFFKSSAIVDAFERR